MSERRLRIHFQKRRSIILEIHNGFAKIFTGYVWGLQSSKTYFGKYVYRCVRVQEQGGRVMLRRNPLLARN